MLDLVPYLNNENKVALINQAFEIKLLELLHDTEHKERFGKTVASKFSSE